MIYIVDYYLLCHGAKLVEYDYNTSSFVFALPLDVNVKLGLKVDDDGGVDDGSCTETLNVRRINGLSTLGGVQVPSMSFYCLLRTLCAHSSIVFNYAKFLGKKRKNPT